MASQSQVATNVKRIDLEDGRWVDVRRVNASIIQSIRIAAHERGFEDDMLDTLAGIPLVLAAREGGSVDQQFIDELTEMDLARVWAVAKGVDIPNLSAPSSDGTQQKKARSKRNGRSNG